MFSEFVLHDALAITSLALLVLIGVLPFVIPNNRRKA
jgi:uncharacterized protein YjeT (DUF2065 family)